MSNKCVLHGSFGAAAFASLYRNAIASQRLEELWRLWPTDCSYKSMDATDKTAERLLEWFRNHAPEDGVQIYDDKDCATIGVYGHIHICKLVAYLLHGNVTHTPGPPPELQRADVSHEELVRQALQNLPPGLANDKELEEAIR